MELEDNNKLPFFTEWRSSKMDPSWTRRATKNRQILDCYYTIKVMLMWTEYKRSLLQAMLNRAFKFSSNWQLFHQECERLKETFARLHYPESLVQATIRQFVKAKVVTEGACPQQQNSGEQEVPTWVILPYKEKKKKPSQVSTTIGVRAGGAGGLQPPQNLGQLRFLGSKRNLGMANF